MKLLRRRIGMGQKELSIHFQEMGELTDELQEIAEEIKNLIQGKGEEILTCLQSSWRGEGGEKYRRKEGELLDDTQQIAIVFRKISQELKEMTEKVYEAEKSNVLLGKLREYW